MGNQTCCQGQTRPSDQIGQFNKLALNTQSNPLVLNASSINNNISSNSVMKEGGLEISLVPIKQKYTATNSRKSINEMYSIKISQPKKNLEDDVISEIEKDKSFDFKDYWNQSEMFKQSSSLLNMSFQEYKGSIKWEKSNIGKLPALTQEVSKTAQYLNLFEKINDEGKDIIYKAYGKDFYHGQIKDKYPSGNGKFFKENGSLYVGSFLQGKANGPGVYVFPDGSYFKGNFKNNKANDEHGLYKSKKLGYYGAILDNHFDGQARECGINHTFKGTFRKNKKAKGVLKWRIEKDQYQYEGTFNKNGNFEGLGLLKQPKGIYNGEFVDGVKHGKATYIFNRGLKYQGQYLNGERQGKGTLYNIGSNGSYRIAYRGEFKKGLPDGKGEVPSGSGQLIQTVWIEGVDSQTIN